jgi:hypothetical protein
MDRPVHMIVLLIYRCAGRDKQYCEQYAYFGKGKSLDDW